MIGQALCAGLSLFMCLCICLRASLCLPVSNFVASTKRVHAEGGEGREGRSGGWGGGGERNVHTRAARYLKLDVTIRQPGLS